MNGDILPELINIQHDLLRVATATTSASPLIKKYRSGIGECIDRLYKKKIDLGTRVLLDFMRYLLENDSKKNYIVATNLVGSFLKAYSDSGKSHEWKDGGSEEKGYKSEKRGWDKKAEEKKNISGMRLTDFLYFKLPKEFINEDVIRLIKEWYKKNMEKELTFTTLKTYASYQIKKMKDEDLIEVSKKDINKKYYQIKNDSHGGKDNSIQKEPSFVEDLHKKISENKDFLNEVCQ